MYYKDPMEQNILKFMLITEGQNSIEKSTKEERLKPALSYQLSGAYFT